MSLPGKSPLPGAATVVRVPEGVEERGRRVREGLLQGAARSCPEECGEHIPRAKLGEWMSHGRASLAPALPGTRGHAGLRRGWSCCVGEKPAHTLAIRSSPSEVVRANWGTDPKQHWQEPGSSRGPGCLWNHKHAREDPEPRAPPRPPASLPAVPGMRSAVTQLSYVPPHVHVQQGHLQEKLVLKKQHKERHSRHKTSKPTFGAFYKS